MARATLVPQEGVTELVLVRHGRPVRVDHGASREDLMDPPLSEGGLRQATLVADALAAAPVEAVYTSDLRRAGETAAPIAEAHGCEVVVYPELREFEAFRDVPAGESVREWVSAPLMRGMSERFVRERTWDSFPHSEPAAEFRNRVASAVETILAAHRGGRVVVACHGGVINAYVAHLWGVREDVLFHPAHGSISRVVAAGDRRSLWTLNELAHLVADGEDHADY